MKNFWKKKNKLIGWVLILFFIPFNHLIDKTVLSVFFSNKIGVHKVNSLDRLSRVNKQYPLVELDVVLIDSLFDIHHPPELPSGLTFNEYLNSIKANSSTIWIDFKNLENANCQRALRRLNHIFRVANWDKHRIIIESSELTTLSIFGQHGYGTAYYLPNELRFKSANFIYDLKNNIRKNQVDYVSGDYRDFKTIFGVAGEKKVLLWCSAIWTPYGVFGMKKFTNIYRALLDDRVAYLILP